MDQEKFKKFSDSLTELLVLKGYPAAVKMVKTSGELEQIQYKGRPVHHLDKNLLPCQLISQARFYGRVIAGEEQRLNTCWLGADAMGFAIVDYTRVYSGTYFSTEAAALKMIDTTPRFERGRYRAMLVAPLDRCPVEPDVVVLYGDAAQMLRIVNGALYDKGGRLEFSSSGDAGLCADTVVQPMLTQKPHVAIPCNGGRIMSLPNETELAFGIPFSMMEGLIEGLEYTRRNVPVMYPTAWQHIDWEAPDGAPISRFLHPEK